MIDGVDDRSSENEKQFKRLQKLLGLPLPVGLPPFVYAEGVDRLRSLQEHPTDEKVDEFRVWVSQVRRCFSSPSKS
jgi:hypothetical protein